VQFSPFLSRQFVFNEEDLDFRSVWQVRGFVQD
jgi:hypothetical protein